MEIRTALIPAAGFGTRFLPITKAIPKEMLPLIATPAIQIIIREGIDSGINRFICITGKHRSILSSYLAADEELHAFLEQKNKLELIESAERLRNEASFDYVTQHEPRGLGHAVAQAASLCPGEFVGIMLPDDIMVGSTAALGALISIAREKRASVIAVQEVPADKVSSYGIINIKEDLGNGLFKVASLVEKPRIEDAPSRLAIVGRYVLSPHIFTALESIAPSSGGEIQLTDAIARLIDHHEQEVYAYIIPADRHDIGNPLGWLKANITIGLNDPTIGPALRTFLASLPR